MRGDVAGLSNAATAYGGNPIGRPCSYCGAVVGGEHAPTCRIATKMATHAALKERRAVAAKAAHQEAARRAREETAEREQRRHAARSGDVFLPSDEIRGKLPGAK